MIPIISIIIPVYNGEDFIVRCMESIQAQTFSHYEVILVNDGSKDSSEKIITDFIKDKTEWKIFSKINEGTSLTRNFGINKSKGQYIAFIDADDFVEKNYLERLYSSLNESDSDLACCGYYDHSNVGVVALNNYSGNSAKSIGVNEFSKLLFSQIGGVLWDKLFDAEIIRENNIKMNLEIYYYEDSLFVLDYLQFTKKISIIDAPLYHYNRINEHSFTKKINHKWKQNIINFNSEIKKKLDKLNICSFDTDRIVARNVSGFILSVFDYEKLSVYNSFEKNKIINEMVNEPFFVKYFTKNNVRMIYKPFHFFYTNKMIAMIIFYSFVMHILKKGYHIAKI